MRIEKIAIEEVILATSATADGQTTAHYIADSLTNRPVKVSGLAHGVPVGGELDYLDEGTLNAALKARKPDGMHSEILLILPKNTFSSKHRVPMKIGTFLHY